MTYMGRAPWILSALGVAAATLVLAGCPEDDCTKTLTCEPPPTGGAGGVAQGGSGAESQGGAGQGGGALLGNGAACTDADACMSGICVDDVCCDAACTGTCSSCALSGMEGTCSFAEPATDPRAECGGGVCNGNGTCVGGAVSWSRAVGSGIVDVEYDPSGNMFIAGAWRVGSLAFDQTITAQAGSNGDSFVAKLDSTGNPLWHAHVTGTSSNNTPGRRIFDMAVDTSGNVIVVGAYQEDIDVDGTLANCSNGATGVGDNFGSDNTILHDLYNGHVFALKLDSAGNCVWLQTWGDNLPQGARSVGVLPGGDVIVGGHFAGSPFFGATEYTSSGFNIGDAFVMRLQATSGNVVWFRPYGDGGASTWTEALEVTDAGDIVFAGRFNQGNTINFGGQDLTSSDYDIFFASLDADATHLWSKRFAGSLPQEPREIASAGTRVALVGSLEPGGTDFGGGLVENLGSGTTRAFIAVFDTATGDHVFSDAFGDAAADQIAHGVAFDDQGDIVLIGSYAGAIDFPDGQSTSSGNTDGFVLKLATDGTPLWGFGFGDTGADEGWAADTRMGSIGIAGAAGTNISFGNSTVSGAFVGGLDP